MTEHMSAFSPDDSKAFEGMQQIWAQYSGKLGEMLRDSSGKDNGPYKELYDLWDQYSNSMSEHASELMKENLKNQQELYELWMATPFSRGCGSTQYQAYSPPHLQTKISGN
jgi:hypothetical protein